ncbi:hypothetical protein KM043_014257 [Ampulex compressa]|nr:hypothetical protein KM043_014257 [Ampulex compressa]
MFETEESAQSEEKKLRNEIKIIKSMISQIMATRRSAGHCKFGDLYQLEKRVTRSQVYSAQIQNVDNHGKLGKWSLPMSIDVGKLLLINPIDDLSNLQYFFRSCKHHVDCYSCRQEQYKELQVIANRAKNFILDGNLGYTRIMLQMMDIRDTVSKTNLDIILYLHYKSDEARPHSLQPESIYEESLLMGTVETLVKYFKPFRKLSLKEALEAVVDTPRKGYEWKVVTEDTSVVEIDSSSGNEEVEFLQYLRKGKETQKEKSTKNPKKHEKRWKAVTVRADKVQDQEAGTSNQPSRNSSHGSNDDNEKTSLSSDKVSSSSQHENSGMKAKKELPAERKTTLKGKSKKSQSTSIAKILKSREKDAAMIERKKSGGKKSELLDESHDKTGTVSSTVPGTSNLYGGVMSSTPLSGQIKDLRKFSAIEISEIFSMEKNGEEGEKRNDLMSREEKKKALGQNASSSDDESDDAALNEIDKKALLKDLLAIDAERARDTAKAVKPKWKK